jgi:hypothetical protein
MIYDYVFHYVCTLCHSRAVILVVITYKCVSSMKLVHARKNV